MDTIVEDRPAPSNEESAPRSPRRRSWRFPKGAFALSLVALIGVMLAIYPGVAAWLSQYYQSQLIVDVAESQQQSGQPDFATQLEEARDYNDLLVSGALLEPGSNKPSADAYQVGDYSYRSLLAATPEGVMGRLRIPAIEVDLPIYHGTDDETLTKGVGHLEGTSLPVGGVSQRSVLTAHRGLPEATLFDNLDQVKVGDTFTVEVFGEVLTYRVRDTQVIQPEDTDTLRAVADEDLVTLVTCTPLGINTHRILVTGERVTPTPIADIERAGQRPDIPGFPWWAVGIGATLLVLTAYVWNAGRVRDTATTDSTDDNPGSDPMRT